MHVLTPVHVKQISGSLYYSQGLPQTLMSQMLSSHIKVNMEKAPKRTKY